LVSPLILNVISISGQAHNYLQMMLLMSAVYMIGKSLNATIIVGIFCAGGDSRFGFICDAIVMWGIVVPLGLIAAFYFKLPVVWVYFIINLDEFIKLPAVYRHYKKYKWLNNLKREGSNN